MTELSLSAINATAPYHLRISELSGFDFDIDAGLTYNIALIEDFRARLFSRWFRDYADDSKYRLLTTSLKVGNVTNYLGAFLRRDNELYDAFCAAFDQFDKDIHKDEPWDVHISETSSLVL